jgi:dienelactone hydrolase
MSSATSQLCPVLLTLIAAGLVLVGAAWAESGPKPIGQEAFKVLTAFYDYDPQLPLEARVVDLQETATGARRKVVFRSARGFLVPGYLELPKAGGPPYPCVLLLHGWSGSKDNWWEDGNYISGGEARTALLARGYAVFALDAQGHGDRIAENDYLGVFGADAKHSSGRGCAKRNSGATPGHRQGSFDEVAGIRGVSVVQEPRQVPNLYNEPGAPPRKNYFTLRDVIVQTVIDCRRAVDYLATRSDIDMRRIGVYGYSLGGFEALALTAAESRIKATVACAVPDAWGDDVVLIAANYGRGIRNRAACLLMGKQDGENAEARARRLYGLIEGPTTKMVLYDAGHQFPVEYVADAVGFIAERL